MITAIKRGNLFESEMQSLIVTVNLVGVMGKGIAFQCKQQFPEVYDRYRQLCNMDYYRTHFPISVHPIYFDGRKIICFPTKLHWKQDSTKDLIIRGLKAIQLNYDLLELKSIAVPPLGCGNGNLDWKEIKPIIYDYLDPLPIPVEIYEP